MIELIVAIAYVACVWLFLSTLGKWEDDNDVCCVSTIRYFISWLPAQGSTLQNQLMPNIPSCKFHRFLPLFLMYLLCIVFLIVRYQLFHGLHNADGIHLHTAINSDLNSGDVNRAILCLLYVNALPSNLFCHQTSNFSISATCANQHSEYELNHLAYILMPSQSPWKRKKKT